MSEAILRADRLTRTVADKALVSEVSFVVNQGEVLAIFGPNGAGKSSLLRLMNRLDEPTSGTVLLEGADYRTIPPRALRQRVGMILQRAYLFRGTVADNVRFGPRQQGQELNDTEVRELLSGVGLEGYEQRDAGVLSGGEAQRVAIARALANRPRVLLMDEPTSSLDDESKRQVEETILRVMREHRLTLVIVTHDTRQAERLASRVLLLRDGRAENIGTPQELLHHAERALR